MASERVVTFRPRTILSVALLLVGVAIVLWIVWVSRRVLIWTFVSIFLAIALDPAVGALQRRGLHRRGAAAGLMYVIVLAVIGGVGAPVIPPPPRPGDDPATAAPRP